MVLSDIATAPVGPSQEPDALLVVDSCHSTWLFDAKGRRFRRFLKGRHVTRVGTGWRPFDRLVLDPRTEAFVVVLDRAGSRHLESWRHLDEHCERCGARGLVELSIEDLDAMVEDGSE